METTIVRRGLLVALVIVFAAAFAVPSAIGSDGPRDTNKGLVAYWSFDDGTATDNSGNGHNGTVYGPTPVPNGDCGAAFYFDGGDDYVNVPDDDALSFGDASDDSPFTFTAWIKRGESPIGDAMAIVSKYRSQTPMRQEYHFCLNPDYTLAITLYDNIIDKRKAIKTNSTLGTCWHHVAVTYDGSGDVGGLTLYVDGAEASITVSADDAGYVAMHNTTQSFRIGRMTCAGGQPCWFHGVIDEVRIYDVALDSAEIQYLFDDLTIIPPNGDTVPVKFLDTFVYYPEIVDPDDSVFTITYPEYPHWCSVQNDSVIGIAPETVFVEPITVIAEDECNADTLSFLVAVYLCGDVNNDSTLNVADLTYLVDYLFFSGPPPPILDAGNVDGEGWINVVDLTYLVDYLFFGGPEPICGPIE